MTEAECRDPICGAGEVVVGMEKPTHWVSEVFCVKIVQVLYVSL